MIANTREVIGFFIFYLYQGTQFMPETTFLENYLIEKICCDGLVS